MKSNLIKTISRSSTVLSRHNNMSAASKPHYYPSKQVITSKKETKSNSLGYFVSFE